MSLPRSIDFADSGSTNYTHPGGQDLVLLVGPRLQTPKDTSFVVIWFNAMFGSIAVPTTITMRVHKGTDNTGAVIGAAQQFSLLTGQTNESIASVVTASAAMTDYFQVCLSAQAPAGTAINWATLVCMSF